MTPTPENRSQAQSRAARRIAFACGGLVFGMVGAAYAAVPLYELFCRVTGFGGTPRVASTESARQSDRTIAVRFDANVAPGLNWSFGPEQSQVNVRMGETKTVFYKLKNRGDQPAIGMATYNVTPNQAGNSFAKLECFCFNEMVLQPGEEIDVPVVFFVDPALADDPDIGRSISKITLSYTFFPAKQKAQKPVAGLSGQDAPKL
jgi:cytochrome c oxidase assembly protein subunit 11